MDLSATSLEYNEHLNEINILKKFMHWLKEPDFKEEFESWAQENPETGDIEIKLDNIKELITTLTIKMKFDIWESENEMIDYANKNGKKAVPFTEFTRILSEWMAREKEKILVKLREENNILVEDMLKRKDKDESVIEARGSKDYNLNSIGTINNQIDDRNSIRATNQDNFVFGHDVDISQIIHNRSLYILKKKFEIYDRDVKEIYEKYCDLSGQASMDTFPHVQEELLDRLRMSFSEISKPQELLKNEIMQQFNKDNFYYILKDIYRFAFENRTVYNRLVNEKRNKAVIEKSLDLNDISKINDEKILNSSKLITDKSKPNDDNEGVGEKSTVNKFHSEKTEKSENKTSKDDKSVKPEKSAKDDKSVKPDKTVKDDKSSKDGKSVKPDKPGSVRDDKSVKQEKSVKDEKENQEEKKDEEGGGNLMFTDKSRQKTNPDELEEINQLRSENINNDLLEMIFIEAYPLIVTDYLNTYPNIVIHDISESDLSPALKILFDDEIIARLAQISRFSPEEENKNKLKELLFEKLNIERNIRNYEDMLIAKKTNKENILFLEQMIDKFRDQRTLIERKINILNGEISKSEETAANNNLATVPGRQNIETQPNNDRSKSPQMHPENHYGSKYYDPTQPYKRVGYRGHGSLDNSITQSPNKDGTKAMNFNPNNISILQDLKHKDKHDPLHLLGKGKEEQRVKALVEIFNFYSHQHMIVGKGTFDNIKDDFGNLDISEFMKFCNEFKIPVRREILNEVFKKLATYSNSMNYDQFLMALNTISVKINDEKIRDLKIKVTKLKNGTNNILPKVQRHKPKHSQHIFPNNKLLQELEIEIADQLERAGMIKPEDKKKMEELNRSRIKTDEGEKEDESIKKSEENIVKNTKESKNPKDTKDSKEVKSKKEVIDTKEVKDTKDAKSNQGDAKSLKSQKSAENKTKTGEEESKSKKEGLEQKYNSDENEGKREDENENRVNESELGSVKKVKIVRKKSQLYEPNLNPKFAYRSTLINIPSEAEIKQKEIDDLNKQIEDLKSIDFETLKEDLYFFLELDHPKQYREKLVGFNIPFRSEKITRIAREDVKPQPFLIDPKLNEEIKRIVSLRKEEKKILLKEMEQYQKIKYYEDRRKQQQQYEQRKRNADRLKLSKPDGSDFNYAEIRKKHDIYEREKNQKLTWDQLENLNFNHFISNRDDDFRPEDILDLDYDSDDAKTFMEMKQQVELRNQAQKKTQTIHNHNVMSPIAHSTTVGNNYATAHKNTNMKETVGDSKLDNLLSLEVSRIHNMNDSKIIDNTEKRAKEKEKLWEDKRQKLLNKYDELVKRGIEKANKFKKV